MKALINVLWNIACYISFTERKTTTGVLLRPDFNTLGILSQFYKNDDWPAIILILLSLRATDFATMLSIYPEYVHFADPVFGRTVPQWLTYMKTHHPTESRKLHHMTTALMAAKFACVVKPLLRPRLLHTGVVAHTRPAAALVTQDVFTFKAISMGGFESF